MLYLIKYYLKLVLIPITFIFSFLLMVITILRKAEWGLFFLVFFIPQPNIWYKFHEYALGNNFLDFLFLSILLGMFFQKIGFKINQNSIFILIFILFSYISLIISSVKFSLPLPISYSNPSIKPWKNYVEMIFLYYFTFNILVKDKHEKLLIIIISLVVLLMSIRCFRDFDLAEIYREDKRYAGPFESVLLNANHMGAFFAHYWAVFLGLFLFDDNKKRKILYILTVSFGVYPILVSFSRGAYIAVLGVLSLLGIIKKRILLIIAVVLLLTWKSILPTAVVERLTMTKTDSGELEESSAHRLVLWDYAINLFRQNPIMGIGLGGFPFALPADEPKNEVHNFFLKTLCEQGLIGGILLILLFLKTFYSGWLLSVIGISPFQKGLGLGFMGCVIACFITNLFGDRFSYFVLGSYFWLLWGLVDRIILNIKSNYFSKEPSLSGKALLE